MANSKILLDHVQNRIGRFEVETIAQLGQTALNELPGRLDRHFEFNPLIWLFGGLRAEERERDGN